MHHEPEAPHVHHDSVRVRPEVFRSSELTDSTHRQPANADHGGPWQGEERTSCAAFASAAEGAADVLERVSASRPAVPGQDAGQDLRRHIDPQGDQEVGEVSGDSQKRLSARDETLVCHRAPRSRSGPVDDQPAAGTRELHHHDGLPALSPRAPDPCAESTRLATGSSTADVSTVSGEREGKPHEEGSAPQPDKLTLVEILRLGASKFADMKMCPTVQSVLAKISVCRTHVMGGRRFRCNACGETSSLYNSCGDRHCPACSGSKRFDFNEKASKLLLPGAKPQVVYYQVVCTLPSELSELALANHGNMADLLIDSAWKSLSKSIRQEQGYEPAAISVLHTWNQRLQAHWHVHLLVPGEGPAIDDRDDNESGWSVAKAPAEQRNSDGYYLVNAARLKAAFRKRAITRLQWLRKQGKLRFGGKYESLHNDDAWDAFIEKLQAKTWVVFIQPPPHETTGAREVINYLTRYLTGDPISDYRITAADEQTVTFMAREGTRQGGERKQVPITLPLRMFIQRWCLHILPEQLTKTRYFGGWANNARAAYMARCRAILKELGRLESKPIAEEEAGPKARVGSNGHEPTAPATTPPVAPSSTPMKCSHCGSDSLALVSETPKPSWREVFWRESETCPPWYATLQREEHRLYWIANHGKDIYDYHMQSSVESAEETITEKAPRVTTQLQLPLTGLTLVTAFETIPF